MGFLTPLLFALAVSADGFMVGLAYGIKRIHIPLLSLIVISLASALAVTVSMICGKGLGLILPPGWTSAIGSTIFIIIGIYFLLRAGKEKIDSLQLNETGSLISLNIRPLGIIVHILKEPSSADLDSSGIISTKEAFFLGFALALDALGAGVALAMSGFNIIFTALAVGALKFILVNSGLTLGGVMTNSKFKLVSALLPGLIFITIGILEYI
ncbi:MAG TPA: sporulation membrane protein YtaF [Syntrophomonadaceae bacterium]|nr:sporulation membrane protein YtaF [Syntrophomonadaceae bacterium]